eukprot:3326815-Alexandrium_andersonii.AAC.1
MLSLSWGGAGVTAPAPARGEVMFGPLCHSASFAAVPIMPLWRYRERAGLNTPCCELALAWLRPGTCSAGYAA